ncbi:hypothetical protein PANT_7d00306 [Moesziomyces antarcticus T-34]|uniref:GATA-type domain-containing protein n=1 Tax=Pseudozyma antarctica (strain T-34) TaxID=1151754 RepID=M9MBQ9_PSEA3|nr:hypothetical protein PANT_7d00306 [Moesziomyces antarcticus T-34]
MSRSNHAKTRLGCPDATSWRRRGRVGPGSFAFLFLGPSALVDRRPRHGWREEPAKERSLHRDELRPTSQKGKKHMLITSSDLSSRSLPRIFSNSNPRPRSSTRSSPGPSRIFRRLPAGGASRRRTRRTRSSGPSLPSRLLVTCGSPPAGARIPRRHPHFLGGAVPLVEHSEASSHDTHRTRSGPSAEVDDDIERLRQHLLTQSAHRLTPHAPGASPLVPRLSPKHHIPSHLRIPTRFRVDGPVVTPLHDQPAMATHTQVDMLVDPSSSISEPTSALPHSGDTQIMDPQTPPLAPATQPSADALTVPASVDAADDVTMSSLQVPDEAALAAAAAAMAAAAAVQATANGAGQHDAASSGINGTDDLNSYLLAAAAASVHAQQQNNPDERTAASEDSFDSTATPIPNSSIYTNATSVNDAEDDDTRSTIVSQCRRYTEDPTPFPLSIGKRTPGGCAELFQATPQSAAQTLQTLPLTEATVELGKTRCYWALLSADYSQGNGPTGEKLHFVYLDPVLQQHMAEQAERLVGSDFYDYVHPEERDRVCDDMHKIVESRTLFGSVTRCRFSRVPRIRELLGAVDPPRDPEADRYVEDESFVAIDIVINWIGDGMLLCFFHAIIDKVLEDNDEQHKSDWTNWCGTPGPSFTLRQCDVLWKQVKAVPREPVPESGPVHVFQIIEAHGDRKVLLSWPPPRFFPREIEAGPNSDTATYNDAAYFADDFARLAQGVSIAPGSSSLSDANTSCTRRFRAKHTLTTEGKVRSIESVLIPYGGVILACFHTTFQQQLPPADPKLVTPSVQPNDARRKAEDDGAHASPNKRAKTEPEASDKVGAAAAAQPRAPSTPATNGSRTPTAKAANSHAAKTPSKYSKPTSKAEGLAALANPSLIASDSPGSGANKACTGCGKINSPEWRRGPTGHKTLCNACGLRYARSLTRRKKKKGKDGEVEFIEPTGDPSVVPKSRGGGGGSLPGVHRKNSKKRKEEEAAKAAAVAAVGTEHAVTPGATASPSSLEGTQSPAGSTPAKREVPAGDAAKSQPAAAPAAAIKVEADATPLSASAAVAVPTPAAVASTAETIASDADAAHSIAVSIALDAIAQATSAVPAVDANALPLPVSNAISRAIAATIGSTTGGAGAHLTSQALAVSDAAVASVPAVSVPVTTGEPDLDPSVSAAALQTIESVVSEALYKQLVQSSLPQTPPADKNEAFTHSLGGEQQPIDLAQVLTADAIRAAAQAAVAQGVTDESQ